jgi:hypothetical protein
MGSQIAFDTPQDALRKVNCFLLAAHTYNDKRRDFREYLMEIPLQIFSEVVIQYLPQNFSVGQSRNNDAERRLHQLIEEVFRIRNICRKCYSGTLSDFSGHTYRRVSCNNLNCKSLNEEFR